MDLFKSGLISKLLVGATLLSTICLLINLLLLQPVTSYKYSVFEGIHLTYILLLISFILILLTVTYFLYIDDYKYSLHLKITLVILLISLMFLPTLRSFNFYGRGGADELAHVGWAIEIIETGNIDPENWYPITHLLIAQFEFIGVPVNVSPRIIASTFSLLFIMFCFIYLRELTKDHRIAMFAVVATIPLLFGQFESTLQPAIRSFIFIPVFLFVFENSKYNYTHRNSLIFIIVLVLGIIYHPTFFIFAFFMILLSIIISNYFTHFSFSIPRVSILQFLLLPIIWFSWYLLRNFVRFQGGVQSALLEVMLLERYGGGGDDMVQSASTHDLSIWDISHIFIDNFGPVIVFGFLGLLTVIHIFRLNRIQNVEYVDVYLSVNFVLGCALGAMFLFTGLIGTHFSRSGRYGILFAILLTAYLFGSLIYSTSCSNNKKLKVGFLLCLVILSFGFSLNNAFMSNSHFTQSEETGIEWYVENGSDDLEVFSFGMSDKTLMYMYGNHNYNFLERGEVFSKRLPRQLGYHEHDRFSEAIAPSSAYLVTKEADTRQHLFNHPAVQDDRLAYGEKELETLHNDDSVHKIYDNQGFRSWLVN